LTATDRVGILGGTFDPIHLGHLAIGQLAQSVCGLSHLLVMPSGTPPHRPIGPCASADDRLAMARLAAEPLGWQVSDLELRRTGRTYTADTLDALRAAAPGTPFFFILGADAFADIAQWHRFPAVLDLAHFVVIARPGHPVDHLDEHVPHLAGRVIRCGPDTRPAVPETPAVILVTAETPRISSSAIRRLIGDGGSPDGLVPDRVARYIADHRLYV
jgi:nicotinate-nucleotide adenylyltransferase